MPARIPSASRLDRAIPDGRQPMVSPAGGEGPSRALQGLGGALVGVAEQINRRDQIDRRDQYNDAAMAYQINLEESLREMSRDPDWATQDERFTNSAYDKLTEIGAGITNGDDRNDFMQEGKLRIERARTALGRQSFQLERSEMRGRVDGQLEQSRDLAVAGEAASLGETSAMVRERLDSAVDKGYYSAEEAAQLHRNWQNSVAVGRVRMAAPENRAELLDNPFIVNNIDPEQVATLRREAEAATRYERAVNTVDDLMQADLDPVERRVRIAEIEDPLDRRAVEERLVTEESRARVAEQARNVEVSEELAREIEGGLTYEEFSSDQLDDFNELPLSMRANLRNLMAGTKRTHSDQHAVRHALELSAAGEWNRLRDHMVANRSAFTAQDYEQFLTTATTGSAPEQVTISSLVSSKFPGADNAEKRGALQLQLTEWRNAYVESVGSEPSNQQMEQELTRRLLDPPERWWEFKPEIYKLDEQQRDEELNRAHMTELRERDEEVYDATRQYLEATRRSTHTRFTFADEFEKQYVVAQVRRLAESGADPEAKAAYDRTVNAFKDRAEENPDPVRWLTLYNRYREEARGR